MDRHEMRDCMDAQRRAIEKNAWCLGEKLHRPVDLREPTQDFVEHYAAEFRREWEALRKPN